MKEREIRDNILRVFSDACNDMQIASSTLKDYCDKHNFSYYDAAHGSLKTDNDVELRRYVNQFFMANGELEGIRSVLDIFYTEKEIDMLHAGCIKQLQDFVGPRFFYDELPSEDEIESCEDDEPSFDSTSQALYGRRYEEAKRAEKAYEKSKQSKKVNDIQDAAEVNAY